MSSSTATRTTNVGSTTPAVASSDTAAPPVADTAAAGATTPPPVEVTLPTRTVVRQPLLKEVDEGVDHLKIAPGTHGRRAQVVVC